MLPLELRSVYIEYLGLTTYRNVKQNLSLESVFEFLAQPVAGLETLCIDLCW